MKSVLVALIALGVIVMAGSSMAAENAAASATKASKEVITVTGTISLTMDAKGAIEGVQLTTADGKVYNVKNNAEGKMLEKDNGKKVEAKGTVSEKDGKEWLTIKSCKAVPEAAAPAK